MPKKKERPPPPEKSESFDPNGRISCSNCDETARAKGGVTYKRNGNRIELVFLLPESWAFRECAVLCPVCAMSGVHFKGGVRRRLEAPELSGAVLAKHSNMRSSLGADNQPNNTDDFALGKGNQGRDTDKKKKAAN